MASVRKKGAGWLMIWSTRDAAGERRQRYRLFTGSSKKDAIAEARRLEEQARGIVAEAGERTVKAALEAWLAAHASKVSARTIERYGQLLALTYSRIGHIALDRLGPYQLETLYGELLAAGGARGGPLSAQTVKHIHAALRKALRDAVRWRWIATSPADGVSPPRVPHREAAMSGPDVLECLLAKITDPDLAAIVQVAALTGCRRQEVLALEWSDVDLDAGTVRVTKAVEETAARVRVKETKSAGSVRTIHLPARCVAVLRAHRARHAELRVAAGPDWCFGDWLFPSYETGGVRRPRNVTKAVARVCRRAGIEGGNLHSFRHGHATALLAAGVAPKVAQARLGHSTISITMDLYSHALPAMDQDAADRLEAIFKR